MPSCRRVNTIVGCVSDHIESFYTDFRSKGRTKVRVPYIHYILNQSNINFFSFGFKKPDYTVFQLKTASVNTRNTVLYFLKNIVHCSLSRLSKNMGYLISAKHSGDFDVFPATKSVDNSNLN